MESKRHRLEPGEMAEGILAGDKVILSRAITMIESTRAEDRVSSQELLKILLPKTGNSIRLGITGVPGVGKSSFIESFGLYVTALGKKVAVLAVDPSSEKSKGSILGDKTRMDALSKINSAYIRPSATGSTLGGVTSTTRESILLCEAAGYDIIIIETVGVGQSEVAVRGMVDFFLLLMLAGAGDELQGIKKGIIEMADMIAITKADGDNVEAAKRAMTEYQSALHLFASDNGPWQTQVTTCSALDNNGIEEIWDSMNAFRTAMDKASKLSELRNQQNIGWLHEFISRSISQRFYNHTVVKSQLPELEGQILAGELPVMEAARKLLDSYEKK